MADPNDKFMHSTWRKQAAKRKRKIAKKAEEAAKAVKQQETANLIQSQLAAKAAEAPKVIAHHRVTGDETLSHLALK